eukprot:6179487-Pleurochrysis_carterae.AAC.3
MACRYEGEVSRAGTWQLSMAGTWQLGMAGAAWRAAGLGRLSDVSIRGAGRGRDVEWVERGAMEKSPTTLGLEGAVTCSSRVEKGSAAEGLTERKLYAMDDQSNGEKRRHTPTRAVMPRKTG